MGKEKVAECDFKKIPQDGLDLLDIENLKKVKEVIEDAVDVNESKSIFGRSRHHFLNFGKTVISLIGDIKVVIDDGSKVNNVKLDQQMDRFLDACILYRKENSKAKNQEYSINRIEFVNRLEKSVLFTRSRHDIVVDGEKKKEGKEGKSVIAPCSFERVPEKGLLLTNLDSVGMLEDIINNSADYKSPPHILLPTHHFIKFRNGVIPCLDKLKDVIESEVMVNSYDINLLLEKIRELCGIYKSKCPKSNQNGYSYKRIMLVDRIIASTNITMQSYKLPISFNISESLNSYKNDPSNDSLRDLLCEFIYEYQNMDNKYKDIISKKIKIYLNQIRLALNEIIRRIDNLHGISISIIDVADWKDYMSAFKKYKKDAEACHKDDIRKNVDGAVLDLYSVFEKLPEILPFSQNINQINIPGTSLKDSTSEDIKNPNGFKISFKYPHRESDLCNIEVIKKYLKSMELIYSNIGGNDQVKINEIAKILRNFEKELSKENNYKNTMGAINSLKTQLKGYTPSDTEVKKFWETFTCSVELTKQMMEKGNGDVVENSNEKDDIDIYRIPEDGFKLLDSKNVKLVNEIIDEYINKNKKKSFKTSEKQFNSLTNGIKESLNIVLKILSKNPLDYEKFNEQMEKILDVCIEYEHKNEGDSSNRSEFVKRIHASVDFTSSYYNNASAKTKDYSKASEKKLPIKPCNFDIIPEKGFILTEIENINKVQKAIIESAGYMPKISIISSRQNFLKLRDEINPCIDQIRNIIKPGGDLNIPKLIEELKKIRGICNTYISKPPGQKQIGHSTFRIFLIKRLITSINITEERYKNPLKFDISKEVDSFNKEQKKETLKTLLETFTTNFMNLKNGDDVLKNDVFVNNIILNLDGIYSLLSKLLEVINSSEEDKEVKFDINSWSDKLNSLLKRYNSIFMNKSGSFTKEIDIAINGLQTAVQKIPTMDLFIDKDKTSNICESNTQFDKAALSGGNANSISIRNETDRFLKQPCQSNIELMTKKMDSISTKLLEVKGQKDPNVTISDRMFNDFAQIKKILESMKALVKMINSKIKIKDSNIKDSNIKDIIEGLTGSDRNVVVPYIRLNVKNMRDGLEGINTDKNPLITEYLEDVTKCIDKLASFC